MLTTPNIISFVGLPGSGKSTIAKSLGQKMKIQSFLEGEEDNYPDEVKLAFHNRDKPGNALRVYKYFRNIRVRHLNHAVDNKKNMNDSIIDCFFDKLIADVLGLKATQWFVNPMHSDFKKIKKIAMQDKKRLPDTDVLVFLRVTEELFNKFINNRGRNCEIDQRIFIAQDFFLKAALNYAQRKNKSLIIIDQEYSVDRVTKILINELKK